MDLLRRLTLLTLKYNIYIRARHLPGKNNEIADSLSRFQFQRFRLLAPQAEATPCKIPVVLLQIWSDDISDDIRRYIDLSVAASTKQTYKRKAVYCFYSIIPSTGTKTPLTSQ